MHRSFLVSFSQEIFSDTSVLIETTQNTEGRQWPNLLTSRLIDCNLIRLSGSTSISLDQCKCDDLMYCEYDAANSVRPVTDDT